MQISPRPSGYHFVDLLCSVESELYSNYLYVLLKIFFSFLKIIQAITDLVVFIERGDLIEPGGFGDAMTFLV